ncbi:MAG: ImmA/IrrE family metallo-endopeptidase [Clostridium botulinum]|uniref:ImmA/IrrE family metallo-endopeptidase n=1 Tax=Clostridium sporogenes TaxID=1509 RepID=UPI001C608F53|nr:ImmA/IrrE family metallo-endopeptidase [Clostridium sporogenes]MBW5456570.1 ImmA/IrrE family metallo-endopeptidase [Clostridium sporogenes]MDU2834256.1 ImmA/IrrE family metallo-endopeptidase [Clostridium botulinum]
MKNVIQESVNKLVKQYKTNNPFDIANAKNIIVIKEPLGSINGYYNKFVRQKIIHINADLTYSKQLFTCAHELGHAIHHPNANTPFLVNNTFYSVNKLERQANMFAASLLIPSDIFFHYEGYSFEYISSAEYIPIELLRLRYEMLSNPH